MRIAPSQRYRRQPALNGFRQWFDARAIRPFDFQRDAWRAYLDGGSGLIHAPTGIGKTYAAWFGPLIEWMIENHHHLQKNRYDKRLPRDRAPHLLALWISPLRALSADIHASLLGTVEELALPWSVESRTGDTPASVRNHQKKRLPTALVTTPESLTLLLSYPGTRDRFRHLRTVVVDEWHVLLGTKRGVLVELALSHLRGHIPSLRTWGLSATLGNAKEARNVLLGQHQKKGRIIAEALQKEISVESIIPPEMDRFPWAGHLGIKLLPEVVAMIETAVSVLIFTNTRSQAEIWYREILDARPDWRDNIGLHHGSLARREREAVEEGLRGGRLKAVVCTSSLDLGVDFSPVDLVIQIGSPKGIARLMQRAGRSGHQPGEKSRVICVPTNALELIEVAAARRSVADDVIEPRRPVQRPLDVLVQHLVTVALGSGFRAQDLFLEVRTTYAYRDLSQQEFEWALDFVSTGGPSLKAYPEYAKITDKSGRFIAPNQKIAGRHRMNIGTITSDAAILVKYANGRRLGSVEERFASRLKRGDCFVFAGRRLEFVRLRDSILWVRKCTGKKGPVPQWLGGRMPLSTELAAAFRAQLASARKGVFDSPEMQAVRPLLDIQANWSMIPGAKDLLIEKLTSREGHHLFVFSFGGHLVNEGIGALLAYRLSLPEPMTISISVNDYGLELLSDRKLPTLPFENGSIFNTIDLRKDILDSLNMSEMAQRQFRAIARIAGLVFQGYPGRRKSWGQVQASSSLIFKVFRRYDPENLLVEQSVREVLERQLEYDRLSQSLDRMASSQLNLIETARPTPLAFPIMVNRLRTRISSEKLADRVRRMQLKLERVAGGSKWHR